MPKILFHLRYCEKQQGKTKFDNLKSDFGFRLQNFKFNIFRRRQNKEETASLHAHT